MSYKSVFLHSFPSVPQFFAITAVLLQVNVRTGIFICFPCIFNRSGLEVRVIDDALECLCRHVFTAATTAGFLTIDGLPPLCGAGNGLPATSALHRHHSRLPTATPNLVTDRRVCAPSAMTDRANIRRNSVEFDWQTCFSIARPNGPSRSFAFSSEAFIFSEITACKESRPSVCFTASTIICALSFESTPDALDTLRS